MLVQKILKKQKYFLNNNYKMLNDPQKIIFIRAGTVAVRHLLTTLARKLIISYVKPDNKSLRIMIAFKRFDYRKFKVLLSEIAYSRLFLN